jgi:beta-N-acetylhexosaminidase
MPDRRPRAAAERERIAHPLVGGLILFARNYAAPDQLKALTGAIRALRDPPPLIAVDHEGGRVQRFRNGFAALPAMRTLGEQWDATRRPPREASASAHIAVELGAHGIDFSFTPVLTSITATQRGDRRPRLAPQSECRGAPAAALCRGCEGGMAAVGQALSGHGFVGADSHAEMPVDRSRSSCSKRPTSSRSAHWYDSASTESCRRTSSFPRWTIGLPAFPRSGCRMCCASGSVSPA